MNFWLYLWENWWRKRKTSIIVGDSLTSDILGGKNAGITTCWFNYRNKENNSDIVPDYEIQSLYELVNLVEEWLITDLS